MSRTVFQIQVSDQHTKGQGLQREDKAAFFTYSSKNQFFQGRKKGRFFNFTPLPPSNPRKETRKTSGGYMHHRDDPRRPRKKRNSFGKRRAHMQILKSPKKKTAQSLGPQARRRTSHEAQKSWSSTVSGEKCSLQQHEHKGNLITKALRDSLSCTFIKSNIAQNSQSIGQLSLKYKDSAMLFLL